MIGLCNVTDDIYSILSYRSDDQYVKLNVSNEFPKKLNGVFIDWMNTPDRKNPNDKSAFQAAIISYYSKKKVPIAIFDRYMCITEKEQEWLSKFNNTYLFEPALNNRKEFDYMPHWININYSQDDMMNNRRKRKIDIGYKSNRKIDAFEKYYIEFMRKFTDKIVIYKNDFDWKDVKFTIAIDTDYNYNIGYLNSDVIDALSNGCMVLLPIEHKYYGNLFYPNVVNGINGISFIVHNLGMYIDGRDGAVLDIYEKMKNNYSEFDIVNTVERIVRRMKRQ